MRALVWVLLPGCLWISRGSHELRLDGDGDGVPIDEDCDDANPTVAPNQVEVPCDNVDNDCNPGSADGPAAIGAITFSTIQDAIDIANTGDTIVLCPGTFREPIHVSKVVTITGSLTPDETLIDASGFDQPVVTIDGPGATLRQVTLTGGVGAANPLPETVVGTTLGGGVLAVQATGTVFLIETIVSGNHAGSGGGVAGPVGYDLQILRSVVRDNIADASGGGLLVLGNAEIDDSQITANTAGTDGGGVALAPGAFVTAFGVSEVNANSAIRGAGISVDVNAVWADGTVRDNVASTVGGGVYLSGGTVRDADILDNAADLGGGISGFGVVLDCTVSQNTAASGGGGVYAEGGVAIDGGTIGSNTATSGSGGGILAVNGLLNLDDLVLQDNVATGPGAMGGGLATNGASLDLFAVTLLANDSLQGGGLAIVTSPDVSMTNTIVRSNSAVLQGGGIYGLDDATLNVCTVETNTAGGNGGGLYFGGVGVVTLNGGSVSSNTSSGSGGGLSFASASGQGTAQSVGLLSNGAADGGAIHLGPGASFECLSCTIADHDILGGGAVSLDAGPSGDATRFDSSTTGYEGNNDADVHNGALNYVNLPSDGSFYCQRDAAAICLPQ